jgi:hypothetical protein
VKINNLDKPKKKKTIDEVLTVLKHDKNAFNIRIKEIKNAMKSISVSSIPGTAELVKYNIELDRLEAKIEYINFMIKYIRRK